MVAVVTYSFSYSSKEGAKKELARSIETVKESTKEADKVAHEANRLAESSGKAVPLSMQSMEQIRSGSPKRSARSFK